MTKADLIAKTLRECRCPVDIGEPLTGDEPDCEEIVVAELSRRLPDTDMKTCEDFQHSGVHKEFWCPPGQCLVNGPRGLCLQSGLRLLCVPRNVWCE